MDHSNSWNWLDPQHTIPNRLSTVRILADGNIEETSPESPDNDILDELIEIIDGHASLAPPNSLPVIQNASPLPPLVYAMPNHPGEHFHPNPIELQPSFSDSFDYAPPMTPTPTPPPMDQDMMIPNFDFDQFIEHDVFQQRLFDATIHQPQRSMLTSHISDVTGSGHVHSESLPRDVSGTLTLAVTEEHPTSDFCKTETRSTIFQPF